MRNRVQSPHNCGKVADQYRRHQRLYERLVCQKRGEACRDLTRPLTCRPNPGGGSKRQRREQRDTQRDEHERSQSQCYVESKDQSKQSPGALAMKDHKLGRRSGKKNKYQKCCGADDALRKPGAAGEGCAGQPVFGKDGTDSQPKNERRKNPSGKRNAPKTPDPARFVRDRPLRRPEPSVRLDSAISALEFW